jgi:predicted transporter
LNLIHYLDQLTGLMQYGMLVHLAVASGLMIWGVKLLAERPKMKQATRISAGLFLVMPCPVCATVILLNLTLALSLSALAPVITTLTLFTLFFAIVAVTWLMLVFGFRHKEIDNLFLGAAMVLIALYFLLTVLIAPIYPKLKPAFAMAVSNNPFRDIDPFPMVIFGCTALSLFGIGFIRKYVNKGV